MPRRRRSNNSPNNSNSNSTNSSNSSSGSSSNSNSNSNSSSSNRSSNNRSRSNSNRSNSGSSGGGAIGSSGSGSGSSGSGGSGSGSSSNSSRSKPQNPLQNRRRNRRPSSINNTFRPPPSVPIPTNRGIKARSQRGNFSKNWWARHWIEAMERLVDTARLQRGRSYARQGQVLTIQEAQNGIEAKVQGSRQQPYKVTIQVTPLTDAQWEQVINALAEQALFTAQLLAGEMPSNIEDAFHSAGVSLFPDQAGDLFTDCSCPDWANPCKHVAATHYILADRFDDDPFLLFRMRGRSQEQILQALRARRASEGGEEDLGPDEIETEQASPLEEYMDRFWEPVESLDAFPLTIRPPAVDMPLLKRLGDPAFLSGESLQDILKPVYDMFMRSALLAAYSEEEPIESNNGHE